DFFFQAEDGIRDFHVTGVQTCALPISEIRMRVASPGTLAMLRERYNAAAIETFFELDARIRSSRGKDQKEAKAAFREAFGREWRSEERRVGKECRSRWSTYHE